MTVSTSQPPLPAPPQPLPAQDRMTRRRSNTTSTDPSPPSAALLPSHVPPKTRANLDSSSSAIPIAPRRAKAIPVIPPPSAPIHGFSSTSGRRVVVEAPVDCGFPPSSAEGKVLEEDLRDGALMAVCACLMASDNQAMGLKELSDLCDAKGWIRPSPAAKTSAIISSALRSHFRRRSTPSRIAYRPPLLSKFVLVGSSSEAVLAPALHPDASADGRRPRGTVWFLSSAIGFADPFERAKLSHLLPEAPPPKKGKRKRGVPAAKEGAPSPSLKIKLKVLGGIKDEGAEGGGEGAVGDEGEEEDDEEDDVSDDGTVDSHASTSVSNTTSTFTRRQRGPSEGFPNFPRQPYPDDDDASPNPSSNSYPNPHPLAITNRIRRPSRHSQPTTASRPLHSTLVARSTPRSLQRSAHLRRVDDSSSSVSSDEDGDVSRITIDAEEGVFQMDEDVRPDGELKTESGPAIEGHQTHQPKPAEVKPLISTPRRTDLPPAPTPAQLLAGDSNPASSPPSANHHSPSTLPPTICPPDLLRITAPLPSRSTAKKSSLLPPAPAAEPVTSSPARQLSLPRMLGPSSPSSPALPPSPLPLHSNHSLPVHSAEVLDHYYSPSSPFRHLYPSHAFFDPNGLPLPSHSDPLGARDEDDFDLRLSLLPGDFEPISLEERGRSSSEEDEPFDDSICTIEGDALSPSTSFEEDGMEDRIAQGYNRDDASRWVETIGVKLEPPSPSQIAESPDIFSRSSSEEEEEDARMVEAIALAGPCVVRHPDEDDVDMVEQSFLGPESVGLEELERVWGGGRKGKMRASFGGAVSALDFGDGFEGRQVEEIVEDDEKEDALMGEGTQAVGDVKREKEAFAQALVDRVRAACVERFEANGEEESDEEGELESNDPDHPEGSTQDRHRKSRRPSNLPKPLPASFFFSSNPSSLSLNRRRLNTAPAAIALPSSALIDVEGFDPMDLLFTPESGVGKGSFPSHSVTKTEAASPTSSTSEVDPLHLGPENASVPASPSVPPCPPPVIPRPKAIRPIKPTSSNTSTEPLTPVSPPLVATVIDSIPVFRCVWSSIVLLRRIDSDHVNLSPLLRAFGIISSGGEKEEEKLLRHVPGGISVQWGEEAAPGVNGVWTTLTTARTIALEYTAGSPLLASFLDPALRSLFPSHISDPQPLTAHESGFMFAPPPAASRTSSSSTIVPAARQSQRAASRSSNISADDSDTSTPVTNRSPRPPLHTNNSSKPAPLRSALSNAVEAQSKPRRGSGRQPRDSSGLATANPITAATATDSPPVRSPPLPPPTKATRSVTGKAQAPISSKTTTTAGGGRKKATPSAPIPAVGRVTRATEAASVRHTRRSSGALPK